MKLRACGLMFVLWTLVGLAGGHAALEDATDARQQQLLNESLRNSTTRSYKDILKEDGGDVIKKPRFASFQVGLLQDLNYESNANYDGNSGQGSFSYSPTVFLSGSGKVNNELRISGTASWSSTWYEGIADSDYWGVTGSVFANYRPFAKWPEFYAGPELNRYESWDDGSEISKSISAVGGLRNAVVLGPGTDLFYNLRYSHRWVEPSQFDRDQVSVLIGLSQRLAPGLYLQPSYSFSYYDYVRSFAEGANNTTREDLRHEAALALIYRVNPYLSLRLSGSFVDNDSSLGRANYQNFTTGLNSGLIYNF